MKGTLSSYGQEFELKLVAAITDNTPFLTQISDILKPSYFFSNASQWVINTALEHYKEYNIAPSMVVFNTEMTRIDESKKVLKQEVFDFLKRSQAYKESKDLEYVKNQTIDFCRNQEIKSAILKSVELLNESDYDGIKATLDTALKSGYTRDIGHIYKDDFELRYSDLVRNTIKTGWIPVDDAMQGGLSSGELGIIVAPAGVGKSWVLVYIGASALKQGKTVVHYTLELNKIYTALRYDSVLTGIDNSNLPLHKEDIENKIKNLPGNLIVENYPTKSASVLTLKSHLDRCIALEKIPDIVIVDYADLLKGHNKELRFELKQIYEGLRSLSAEYGIPIWTASQSNRSSLNVEIIEGDHIAEDYSKIAIGDFIMSLSRRSEDKLAGVGRFHIIKNRFGPDGITFPARIDASNGTIEMFRDDSKEAYNVKNDLTAVEKSLRDDQKRFFLEEFRNINNNG
jgi:replicative DNA helicase